MSYDVAGRWLIEGNGSGKKTISVQLKLDGTLDIQTEVVGEKRCITGYDLWLRIDASRLSIKAWTERYPSRVFLFDQNHGREQGLWPRC